MSWQEWEREHSDYAEEDDDGRPVHQSFFMRGPASHDPVGSEYERLCGIGSEILRHIPPGDDSDRLVTKLVDTWSAWAERVKILERLIDESGKDEPCA